MAREYRQLDALWLAQNIPGGEGFAVELLGMFVEQCSEMLPLFNAAVSTQELAGVREWAHKLKGSASALGIRGVSDSMSVIEARLRRGASFASIRELLEGGICAIEEAVREAEDYRKRIG